MVLAGCTTSTPVRTASNACNDGDGTVEETIVVKTGELHKAEAEEAEEAPAEAESAECEEEAEEQEAEACPNDRLPAYRIGAGDILSLHSFDDETLNTEVVVRYDGHVSLPQVDDVKVEGLTREEATALVSESYAGIFPDPLISLAINQVNSKVYSVMGNVVAPGPMRYERALSLLDGIMMAGGLRTYQRGGDSYVSAQGQLVKAFIIRHVDGERLVTEHDLRGLEKPGSHAGDTLILPGDLIYVPDSVNLVYLLGEVMHPSVSLLTPGMTLLRLIASAGGFDEATARLGQVVLMREIDEENTKIMLVNVRRILRSGGDILLEPGDIVYVPRKPLVKLQTFVAQFTGTVSPLLDMYMDAYEAYYTRERLDLSIEDVRSSIKTRNRYMGQPTAFTF